MVRDAGPAPEVVIEATWGWYWAADVITEAGGTVHLAHPLGIAAFENRRLKTDRIDVRLLADLLRMGMLPEAWIGLKTPLAHDEHHGDGRPHHRHEHQPNEHPPRTRPDDGFDFDASWPVRE